MQRTFSIITLLLGFSLLFTACTKEKSYEPRAVNTGGNGNNGNGSNGGTGNNGSNGGNGNNGNGSTNVDNGAIGLRFSIDGGATVHSSCVTSSHQPLGSNINFWVFSGISDDGLSLALTINTYQLAKGSYTEKNGAATVAVLNTNDPTQSWGVILNTNSSITATVTALTATTYTISFSGKMIAVTGTGTKNISGTVRGTFGTTSCPE